MTPGRRYSGAREMTVIWLRHSKHHVSIATVTKVTMKVQLGTVISVLSVRFAPTVMLSNCRVTTRRGVFRAFRPKAIQEEPVVGFAASQPLQSSPPFDSGKKKTLNSCLRHEDLPNCCTCRLLRHTFLSLCSELTNTNERHGFA
jgi:hypothetical protein